MHINPNLSYNSPSSALHVVQVRQVATCGEPRDSWFPRGNLRKIEMERNRTVIHRCLYCLSAIRISVRAATIYHHSAIIGSSNLWGTRFTVAMTQHKNANPNVGIQSCRRPRSYLVGWKCGYHRVSRNYFSPPPLCRPPIAPSARLYRVLGHPCTYPSTTRAFQQSSWQYAL